jgi:hypothetical protein
MSTISSAPTPETRNTKCNTEPNSSDGAPAIDSFVAENLQHILENFEQTMRPSTAGSLGKHNNQWQSGCDVCRTMTAVVIERQVRWCDEIAINVCVQCIKLSDLETQRKFFSHKA